MQDTTAVSGADAENAGPTASQAGQWPKGVPVGASAHKTSRPARHPLGFISSNTAHAGSRTQPLQAHGPLLSAILASRARQQQDSTTAGAHPLPATHPQRPVLQPQHPIHDPATLSTLRSSVNTPGRFSRQPAQVISTDHPGTGPTQHAAPAHSGHAPSWQQQLDQFQYDHERLPAHSISGQRSNTPGSSAAALQRLQHQQQLRWRFSRVAAAGAGARSMGQALAVPFTQHPAVQSLLSHHHNPLFDDPSALSGGGSDPLSTRSSLSSNPAPPCSRSTAPQLAHSAGQAHLAPCPAESASMATHNTLIASTSSSSSSCGGRPRRTGTSAEPAGATQQAAAAASAADRQAILQRLQLQLQAGQMQGQAVTAQAGLEQAPPASCASAANGLRSAVSRQRMPTSTACAASQHALQAGWPSQNAHIPSTAQLAIPLTQLPHSRRQSSQQSSADSSDFLAAGPVRYADRREAGLASIPGLTGQLPAVQSQHAEHMLVKPHRSQKQRQPAVGEHASTHSFAGPAYSLFPAQTSQTQASSSRGTARQQPEVAAAASRPGPRRHLPVDIDLLPLPGPLTASLRVSQGSAAIPKPHSSLAAAVAQPGMPAVLSAQHGSVGSILDGIQLNWEGGSSASAAHITASAPRSDSAPAPAGKAFKLLAGKAVEMTAKLQRRPSERPVSRLHAASYPSAPRQHDASAVARPVAATASASVAATRRNNMGAYVCAAPAAGVQHITPNPSGMLHAAMQLQKKVPVRELAASSSGCSSEYSAAAGDAKGLQGSRLSLWQRQLLAEPDAAKRPDVSGELRASIAGAMRRVRGAVRGGTGGRHNAAAAAAAEVVQQPVAACVTEELSPAASLFLSPADPAEVFFTPAAADSCSDSGGGSPLGSSSSSSSSSSTLDSLADTAQSTATYALQPHALGLSRGTPFVGLVQDDAHDDYVLTALREHHGKAAHTATYWIAAQREDRAAKLGSRACRRLTWDKKGTRQLQQEQQQQQPQPHPPTPGHAAVQQPHGQPVQPASHAAASCRARPPAGGCLSIEQALAQQEREWQHVDRTAALLLRLLKRGYRKPWRTAPAKL